MEYLSVLIGKRFICYVLILLLLVGGGEHLLLYRIQELLHSFTRLPCLDGEFLLLMVSFRESKIIGAGGSSILGGFDGLGHLAALGGEQSTLRAHRITDFEIVWRYGWLSGGLLFVEFFARILSRLGEQRLTILGTMGVDHYKTSNVYEIHLPLL